MVLVFIILGIIILIYLIALILILSSLKIEIKKLHISNIQNKLKVNFVLSIGIYFLDKIKLANFTIDNEKITKAVKTEKIDVTKLKYNKLENKELIKILEYSNLKIEFLKLEGYFSTFNTVLSSGIYAFINAIVPIIIARKINGKYINNLEFLNINDNKININFNCIISVKMVNIINILQYLKIKKKGGNNNGKSSNRRTYAYSNE